MVFPYVLNVIEKPKIGINKSNSMKAFLQSIFTY